MAGDRRFDHYEVLERENGSLWELGRGAMGVTYKAMDTDLHCLVALKVINPAILDTEGTEQRFFREARAAAQLRHPNIATVLRLGRAEDGTHFYAMEFCEGPTLEELVANDGPLPIDRALNYTLQVTRALILAEEHGVVHRDIKPSNLIVMPQKAEEPLVKVIDFGLAKSITAGGNSWTSMSMATAGFIGTAHFSSPEQLEEGQVDVRSDIYSLGATLWFMVTAKPMFSGSVARVMSQHLAASPPWEQLTNLNFPAEVRDLLTVMLAKSPADRPQTGLDLKHRIEKCIEASRTTSPLTAAPTPEGDSADRILEDRWKVLEKATGLHESFYRAVDLKERGKIVGLTVLSETLLADDTAWLRLEQAVGLMTNGPKTLLRPLTVVRNSGGQPFLITEWVDGMPLAKLLRRAGALSWKETLHVLGSLASAFDFVVERKIECSRFSKDRVMLAGSVESIVGNDLKETFPVGPDTHAVIDLLPITEGGSGAGETLMSMSTILPGQQSDAAPPQVPRIFDFALLAYEILGGSFNATTRRYIPLPRISAAVNNQLSSILTADASGTSTITAAAFTRRLADNADSVHFTKEPATTTPSIPVSPSTPPQAAATAPTPAAMPTQTASLTSTPTAAPVAPPAEQDAGLVTAARVEQSPIARPETTPPVSTQAKSRAALGAWLGIAAALIAMGLLGWFLITKYSGGSKRSVAVKPAPAQTTESHPALPAPNGNLVSTEYSPNGDIRVEHRSGGWLYLFSAKDESKRFSLRQTSEEAAYVLFSPDEKWLVINERGHLNDASARLYRRTRPDDVEFAEASSDNTSGGSLADGGWQFYLREVNLPESTAREQVRLSGIEWTRDSTGVKLRFDSFGPNGQKIVPVPYICNYIVSENRFASETDVAALRAMVKEPVAASSSMPPIFNEPTSSPVWEKAINDFVIGFVQVNQSPDTNGIVDCYAPTVNYFDQGKVDHNVIRTDVQKYNERWPIRHDDIENGHIGTEEISPQSDYVVSFNQNFLTESPTRRECIRGKMAVTMHVTLEGGPPKITAIQQKNLQRDKGVLEVGNTGFVEVWQTGKQHAARGPVQSKVQEAPANSGQMDPAAAQIMGRLFPGMIPGPGGAPSFSNPAGGHGAGKARVHATNLKKAKSKKQDHP